MSDSNLDTRIAETRITNTAGNADGFIHIHRHTDGSEHNAIGHYTTNGNTFECLDCGATYDLATGEWIKPSAL